MTKQTTDWWAIPLETIVSKLETNIQTGLTSAQLPNKYDRYGLNAIPEEKISAGTVLLRQFKNIFFIVLLTALLIAFFLTQYIQAAAIGAIMLLNVLIGFIQEYNAEKSIEALKDLAPAVARVLRDADEQTIPASKLLPGDIVFIQAGNIIPADGRIIESHELSINQAALTGESIPSQKEADILAVNTPMADLSNMVFMGTSVVRGNGIVVITNTGKNTQLGSIAGIIQSTQQPVTHLEKKIRQLTRKLLLFGVIIVVAVLILYILRGIPLAQTIITALSLSVAAIPEGLPTIMIITLALGVQKMARAGSIIRNLNAIEALGSVTVICTDKTGTLTKNEMSVGSIWILDTTIKITGVGYEPTGTFQINGQQIDPKKNNILAMLFTICGLANNAQIEEENGRWQAIGDPTEAALVTIARKAGFSIPQLHQTFHELVDFPFDQERKRVSTFRQKNGHRILFIQGAPEIILDLSTEVLAEDDQTVTITPTVKNKIKEQLDIFAKNGLRVIAAAFRNLDEKEKIAIEAERDLVFVGLLGLIDLPRPEAKEAIHKCHTAGIKVVMITGDHKETAIAIAKELNILTNNNQEIITGTALNALSDEQLVQKIENIAVYARTNPEQKIRIVQAWQEKGHSVAMTGDGVNDAPAIARANVGVAMGITGTQVTKQTADMIISDDNFASLVQAIALGRGILDNIIKFIYYLVCHNIAELIIIFLAILFNFTDKDGKPFFGLLPIQLLWLNLVTDGIIAIALAFDPAASTVMQRPPRRPNKPLITIFAAIKLLFFGFFVAIVTFIAGYFGLQQKDTLGYSYMLTCLILLAIGLIGVIRKEFKLRLFSNKWLWIAFFVSLCLHILILYTPLHKVFVLNPLKLNDWLFIVMIATLGSGFMLLVQMAFKRENKGERDLQV